MLRGKRGLLLGGLILVVAAAAAVAYYYFTQQQEATPKARPPVFALYVPEPRTERTELGFVTNWKNPSGIAATDDAILVLDSGNGRVLVFDTEGELQDIIGETGEAQLLLKEPEALAVLEDRLYIANTLAGEVVILTLAGEVERTIPLPKPEEGSDPRPSGIVVLANGEFYVSDRANNVVLHYDKEGGLLGSLGAGQDEAYRFKEPRGLTVDAYGSIYVADSLNGRVKKFSPQGRFLAEYLMKDNPDYYAPVAVAVGANGTIYFSDGKRGLVRVFSHKGKQLGSVGFFDASKIDSPAVLRDPASLWMVGNRLYVIDRLEGLFAFDIDPAYWTQTKTGIPIH